MKEIYFKEKNVYGNVMLYPKCEDSNTFAKLLGKKTLNHTDIHYIEALGYKVTIEKI